MAIAIAAGPSRWNPRDEGAQDKTLCRMEINTHHLQVLKKVM